MKTNKTRAFRFIELIAKANPYHDMLGRFAPKHSAHTGGGKDGGAKADNKPASPLANAPGRDKANEAQERQWQLLDELVEKGRLNPEDFIAKQKEFNDATKDGVEAADGQTYTGSDITYAHMTKSRLLNNEPVPSAADIVNALKEPYATGWSIDRHGNKNKAFLSQEGEELYQESPGKLLVLVGSDSIRTAYEPSANTLKKIDWTILKPKPAPAASEEAATQGTTKAGG